MAEAVIDIPKRRHQQIRYVDERVRLDDYDGERRQVAVQGLGRENPTLCFYPTISTSLRRELIHQLCPS